MAKVYQRKMSGSLCDQCSKLSLDDSVLRDPEIYAAANATAMEGKLHSEFTLLTQYQINDTIPDLPFLRSSEDSGCACCRYLRHSILAANTGGHGPITFELQYKWQNREINALYLLGIAQGLDGKRWSIPFVVEADTGNILAANYSFSLNKNRNCGHMVEDPSLTEPRGLV